MLLSLKLILSIAYLFSAESFALFENQHASTAPQTVITRAKAELQAIKDKISKLEVQDRSLKDDDPSESALLQEIGNLRQQEEAKAQKLQELQLPDSYACNSNDQVRMDQASISVDKPNIKGPLNGVPVMDQNKEGLCYAASDAILYKSFRPEKSLPSFIDIGITSKEDGSKTDTALGGGDQCDALNKSMSKGLCPVQYNYLENPAAGPQSAAEQASVLSFSSQVINDFDSLSDENKTAAVQYGKKLMIYFQGLPAEQKSKILTMSSADFNKLLQQQNQVCTASALEPAALFSQKLINHIQYLDPGSLDVISQKKSAFERLKLLTEPKCGAYRDQPDTHALCTSLKVPFPIESLDARKKWLRNNILAALYSNHPKSIGIQYCGFVLSRAEFETKTTDQCKAEDETQKGVTLDGDHGSVVIGARKAPGKSGCEYLIQNSFGAGCGQYAHPDQCEDGKVWVSEDALARNIYSLSSMSEK